MEMVEFDSPFIRLLRSVCAYHHSFSVRASRILEAPILITLGNHKVVSSRSLGFLEVFVTSSGSFLFPFPFFSHSKFEIFASIYSSFPHTVIDYSNNDIYIYPS